MVLNLMARGYAYVACLWRVLPVRCLTVAMEPAPDQFYTGLIADAYAPLRGTVISFEPFERFVRRSGEPALEIGCGHGEPLLDLVARGLDVTGLDSSADMLALCAADALRRGLKVDLIHSPMEQLDVRKHFRSIYFAGPTFQLVIDEILAGQALTCIAAHLEPNGRALIPLFRPNPTDPATLGVWREHSTSTAEVLAFQVVSENYRPEERRVDTKLRYRRGPIDSPIEQIDRIWSLRWYEAGEFETLAHTVGLTVDRVKVHGEHARTYELTLDE